MRFLPRLGLAAAAAGAAVFIAAHVRGNRLGRKVEGGILVGDAAGYDLATRLLLGPLYRSIAQDVAKTVRPGARVLEVGCGPGRLSIALARDFGLDVTGLDLDPAMIERAKANAAAGAHAGDGDPSFVVGDVVSLPFPDAAFDIVVSTLSMHHWDDKIAGLTDIARVLKPDGRALVWDLRPGRVPFHAGLADPVAQLHTAPLGVVSANPWRWPWRLSLVDRIELEPIGAPGSTDAKRPE